MTTKHQVRERTNYAVKLLLLGHSTSVVVGKVAEREGCSRRTARRIAARALKVVKDDVDKVNIENPELAALLIHQLQEIAAKGLETGQLGSSVAALRELSAMVGIGASALHDNRCSAEPSTATLSAGRAEDHQISQRRRPGSTVVSDRTVVCRQPQSAP